MKIHYTFQQRAIAACSGTLDVPDDVIAQGDAAVHEFIRENEPDANDVTNGIIEWNEEVEGTMEYEKSGG